MFNFRVRRILRYAINVLLLRPCDGDLPQPTQRSRDACSHPRVAVATESIPTELSYFFESISLLVIFSAVNMTGKRQKYGKCAQPIRKRIKIDFGSSGSIVSDYGLDDRAIEVRSPSGAEDFSSSPCVQTGSGAHPASYPMGTGGSFPEAKARPGRDADHSPPSSAEVKYE
jgi:hypothetical protein